MLLNRSAALGEAGKVDQFTYSPMLTTKSVALQGRCRHLYSLYFQSVKDLDQDMRVIDLQRIATRLQLKLPHFATLKTLFAQSTYPQTRLSLQV